MVPGLQGCVRNPWSQEEQALERPGLRQVLTEPVVRGVACSGVEEPWTPSLEHPSSQVSIAFISEERGVWSPSCPDAVLSFSFA